MGKTEAILEDHVAKAESTKSTTVQKGANWWNPLFLQRRTLLVFLLIYAALIVAFGAISSHSNKHHGLGTVPHRNYLLWQYGPTAGFTLIAAFWGQVVYRAKQLAPWQLMAEGPQPAERSILLDFVSPFNPTVLFRSLRTPGTRTVTLAIIGSMLLRLITILSTGLFFVQSILMEHEHKASVLDTFSDPILTDFNSSSIDHRPISRVSAINSNNLPYPLGTTPDYAFQQIDLTNVPKNAQSLTGTMDAFYANITCEPLSLLSTYIWKEVNVQNQSLLHFHLKFHSEKHGIVNANKIIAIAGNYFYDLDLAPKLEHADEEARFFVISLGKTVATYDRSTLDPNYINMSNILCQPDYGISPAMITLDLNGSTISIPNVTLADDELHHKLPGLSSLDLVNLWGSSTTVNGLSILEVLTTMLRGSNSSDLISNSTLLSKGVEQIYRSITAQIAKIYLMSPTSEPTNTAVLVSEDRLVIRKPIYGIIQGLLLCLVVLTAGLVLLVPTDTLSCNPGSVGGSFMILARCPDLTASLRGMGACHLTILRQKVGFSQLWLTERASTQAGQGFRISAQPSLDTDTAAPRLAQRETENPRWYIPPSVRLPVRLFLMAAIFLIIAALDVLYRFSQLHTGIIDLGSASTYVTYAFTIIPAFVLASIGLMFAGFDFNVRLFQPYHVLRHVGSKTSGRKALFLDYLGKVRLHCLWSALRHRHIPVVASSIGMMAAPFLTIVVSGLYHTSQIPGTFEVTLSHNTSFFVEFPALGSPDWYEQLGLDELYATYQQGTANANLMALDNTGEPPLTDGHLAFPQLTALWPNDSHAAARDFERGQIFARVPTVRSRANCTAIPAEGVYADETYPVMKKRIINFCAKHDQSPSDCLVFSPGPNLESATCLDSRPHRNGYGVPIGFKTQPGMYFGYFYDAKSGFQSCLSQRYLAVFGQVDLDGVRASNLSAFTCSPFVESVMTDVVLHANGLSIDRSSFFKPDERTAVLIHNLIPPFLSSMLYGGFVPHAITNDSQTFRLDNLTDSPATPSQAMVDGFFALMLAGKGARSPADLAGPANQETLLAAMEDLYSRIVAQVFNVHRVPPTPAEAALTFRANASFPTQRLRQNHVSTRILQALLGTMLLCMLVTQLTLKFNDVLPKNPCSIAAGASLLVDADMLDVVPEGAEWMTPKEIEGVLGDSRVSMGWWRDGRFRIGFGRAEKENLAG